MVNTITQWEKWLKASADHLEEQRWPYHPGENTEKLVNRIQVLPSNTMLRGLSVAVAAKRDRSISKTVLSRLSLDEEKVSKSLEGIYRTKDILEIAKHTPKKDMTTVFASPLQFEVGK